MHLPRWAWAFVAFRLADGLTTGLIALSVLTVYGQPAWAAAAAVAMVNLASVPATFAWGRLIQEGRGRRRLAVGGFTAAAFGAAMMAAQPPLLLFLVGGIVFAVFGVATAPAASTLILEGRQRSEWAPATASLSYRTGGAFLTGLAATIVARAIFGIAFEVLYLASAALALLSAVVAHRTIVPFDDAPATPAASDDAVNAVMHQASRRFERAIYLPSRLREVPRLGGLTDTPAFPMLVGVLLAFTGSALLLACYAGILSDVHGYSATLVLLASAPAAVTTLVLYRFAGKVSAHRGDRFALSLAAALRTVSIIGLALGLALPGASLPILLVSHGIMGISFAFLQVSGAVVAASVDPRSHGAGIGAYHGTVALGVLAGSVSGAFLLWATTPTVTVIIAAAITATGSLMLHLKVPTETTAPERQPTPAT